MQDTATQAVVRAVYEGLAAGTLDAGQAAILLRSLLPAEALLQLGGVPLHAQGLAPAAPYQANSLPQQLQQQLQQQERHLQLQGGQPLAPAQHGASPGGWLMQGHGGIW